MDYLNKYLSASIRKSTPANKSSLRFIDSSLRFCGFASLLYWKPRELLLFL